MLLSIGFNREGLLAPRPTPKLEDHPSSAVRDCLFNLFAATLLIGGRSSIRNLRTRHAVVTGITTNKVLKNNVPHLCPASSTSGCHMGSAAIHSFLLVPRAATLRRCAIYDLCSQHSTPRLTNYDVIIVPGGHIGLNRLY